LNVSQAGRWYGVPQRRSTLTPWYWRFVTALYGSGSDHGCTHGTNLFEFSDDAVGDLLMQTHGDLFPETRRHFRATREEGSRVARKPLGRRKTCGVDR
jgi:hypothetical protein